MKHYFIIILFFTACLGIFPGLAHAGVITDPESALEEEEFEIYEPDSFFDRPDEHLEPWRRPDDLKDKDWWYLLRHGKFDTKDTTIHYPKFLQFCVNVYNWADKTFNSYDTTYVQGTGRRWKVRVLSDNWVDSYYINPGKKIPVRIASDPYFNIGAYIQYMAVSVGYSFDINNLIGKSGSGHKKLEYSFNCARFNIEGHYWQKKGSTFIRTFGGYNNGKLTKKLFEGVDLSEFEVCGYYFFNNRKYSMGAAYNFSKYQRKSAGSAIIGFAYNNTDISVDFNKLHPDLLPYLHINPDRYKFHYRSYALVSGYSFNWVLHRNLLFNISAFPGVGFSKTYADNSEGEATLCAVNFRAQSSLTYNLKDLFICGVAKMFGNWYLSGSNTFFSSVENVQISVGWRF